MLKQAQRNWGGSGPGGGTAALPQIFAKVDLSRINDGNEKKRMANKYKLVEIPRKLLAT